MLLHLILNLLNLLRKSKNKCEAFLFPNLFNKFSSAFMSTHVRSYLLTLYLRMSFPNRQIVNLLNHHKHSSYSIVSSHTCSNPPSSSVVSMALFIARIFRWFPVNEANICTIVDLPHDWGPTYKKNKQNQPLCLIRSEDQSTVSMVTMKMKYIKSFVFICNWVG